MKAFPVIEDSRELIDALIARVSAGEPLEIGGELEQIDLNYVLTRGNPDALLIRVEGESMADEIHDGDWVMLDRSRRPQPNDIVLAYLNGGYTLKRHKLNVGPRRGLYLVPANSLYETKAIKPEDEFEIFGVVTSIIRKLI